MLQVPFQELTCLKPQRLILGKLVLIMMKNLNKNISPFLYVQKIVLEKERQFLSTLGKDFQNQNLLFADSIVCIDEKFYQSKR